MCVLQANATSWGCVAGPTVADASKINKKTVEAHKALQGGLVNLGQALAEGQSPAQLRELAASRGIHVQDPLRVSPFALYLTWHDIALEDVLYMMMRTRS